MSAFSWLFSVTRRLIWCFVAQFTDMLICVLSICVGMIFLWLVKFCTSGLILTVKLAFSYLNP
jgi:hypothetical protein